MERTEKSRAGKGQSQPSSVLIAAFEIDPILHQELGHVKQIIRIQMLHTQKKKRIAALVVDSIDIDSVLKHQASDSHEIWVGVLMGA